MQCTGDISTVVGDEPAGATTATSPTYQSTEGYGICASSCIGTPGAVSFNWKLNNDGSAICQCLRMVSDIEKRFYKLRVLLFEHTSINSESLKVLYQNVVIQVSVELGIMEMVFCNLWRNHFVQIMFVKTSQFVNS